LLFVGGVFLAVFVTVCVVAFLLLVKSKTGPTGSSTFQINLGGRLPVSKETVDLLQGITTTGLAKPKIDPQRQTLLDKLDRSRAPALKIYRILMLLVGLGGLMIAGALFRDATPANMQLLPASIVLLLSAAALLEAWIPKLSFGGWEPAGSSLKDRISIKVTQAEPKTLTLTEDDIERVRQFMRQGLSLERAAFAAYPGFDGLDEFERQALLHGLEKAINSGPPARP
jgi:hypothetical protein